MKKIITGSGDFLVLRKENVIYADETAYMRRLASPSSTSDHVNRRIEQ